MQQTIKTRSSLYLHYFPSGAPAPSQQAWYCSHPTHTPRRYPVFEIHPYPAVGHYSIFHAGPNSRKLQRPSSVKPYASLPQIFPNGMHIKVIYR